jgi:hypothetical protein
LSKLDSSSMPIADGTADAQSAVSAAREVEANFILQ